MSLKLLPVLFASISLITLGCGNDSASTKPKADDTAPRLNRIHHWDEIGYPISVCLVGNGYCKPSLSASDTGLCLHLGFIWPIASEALDGFQKPEGDKFQLRLHFEDGKVVEPSQSDLESPLTESSHMGRNIQCGYSASFPWGENCMQEAWVEIEMPQKTIWLHVPYGFTSDPTEEAPVTIPHQTGSDSIRNFLKEVEVLPWKGVLYSPELNDGFKHLLVFKSDAKIALVMSKSDSTKVSPDLIVGVSVQTQSDEVVGTNLSSKSFENGQRVDEFKFEYDLDVTSRTWDTLNLSIQSQESKLIFPSSLFSTPESSDIPK